MTVFLAGAISLSLQPQGAYAIEDKPEDLNNAIESADGSGSRAVIKGYLDHCNSFGLTINNPQYEKCILDRCADMKTRQYRDVCVRYAFLRPASQPCGYLLPGGPAESNPPAYLSCVTRTRQICNSQGGYAYKGKSPKEFCFLAAALTSSPYYLESNRKSASDGGVKAEQAYKEYLNFVKGGLSPADELVLIDKAFNPGAAPGGPGKEPTKDSDVDGDGVSDDKDKSNIECDKDCMKEKIANAEVVPAALKCKSGGGIQISTSINGNNCIGVSQNGGIDDNPIINLLRIVLKVATAGVGLVVAAMIVVAGIQYSTSQGNPQRTVAAKQRLINALIGLLMFIFATAILNYVVPGGIIGGV